ncbi:MAG: gamma carbonic anhydrase family protein [Cardiobacteriaceae bacterium]|nr:gamma carbonic anhydrase family protein [Cardiobacteriaceae bacterium]
MIRAFGEHQPHIAQSAWVHELAFVNGKVTLGERVSVFPSAVIRGDLAAIVVGDDSNIQDGAVLHTTHQSAFFSEKPLTIGRYVTVGHGAILHGCTIGDEVLIGMGATVLDGAVVENQVLLAAGSLVTPNKRLTSGYLYAGSPARQVRPLTDEEKRFFQYSAQNYAKLGAQYKAEEANNP